jgi:hypothetical protein
MGGIAKSHRSSLMTFLRLQQAVPPRAIHSSLSGLFHPDNTPELSPSGLCAVRRLSLSPSRGLPCRFDAELSRRVRLRRVNPSGKRDDIRKRSRPCPHGVFPSEALPLAVTAPASRSLLSRAWVRPPAEASLWTCTSECWQQRARFHVRPPRMKGKRHRPLWGLPPRRLAGALPDYSC